MSESRKRGRLDGSQVHALALAREMEADIGEVGVPDAVAIPEAEWDGLPGEGETVTLVDPAGREYLGTVVERVVVVRVHGRAPILPGSA